jgi:hypothetical protein
VARPAVADQASKDGLVGLGGVATLDSADRAAQ